MAYARRRDEWSAGVRKAVSSLGTLAPPSEPRWPVALQMAITLTVPIAVGIIVGRVDLGLLAATGAFSVPYFISLPRLERLRLRPIPGLALIISAALGGALGHHKALATAGLVVVAICAAMGVYAYRLGPPGPLFPVLVYGMGASAVAHGTAPLTLVACVAAGCVLAVIVSVAPLVRRVHWQVTPRPYRELLARTPWDRGRLELVARVAVVALAGSIVSVLTVDPERAYWVVGAGIVVVGFIPSRVPAIHRGVHRVIGTLAGALVYLGLTAAEPGAWLMLAVLFALQFFTEVLLVRHYALAVTLLTPLALTLATASSGQLGSREVALERVIDTAVGATIGVLTAFIHRPDVDRTLSSR